MNPFDTESARYDAWFDSPEGHPIFAQEMVCLRELIGTAEGRWLEVGVGTGRFAQGLGIRQGIDPSFAVLAHASRRGIRTQAGYGENSTHEKDTKDTISIPSPGFTRVSRWSALLVQRDSSLAVHAAACSIPPALHSLTTDNITSYGLQINS